MFAVNAQRVRDNTAEYVNQEIEEAAAERVRKYARMGKAAYVQRLKELDAEWDIERLLQVNSTTISLAGLALGAGVNRKWLFLPLVIQGFLLQHALQGWCPPLPILRRLGYRTAEEIQRERYALKALRGDFNEVGDNPARAIEAAE